MNCKTFYDPNQPPASTDWLGLGEAEKLRLVGSYHSFQRIPVKSAKDHANLHVVVEDHLARGHGPCKRALDRLLQSGISRHEAVHALGEVMSDWYRESRDIDAPEDQAAKQHRQNLAFDALCRPDI